MKLRADEGLATSTTGERHNGTARHRSGADPAARFVVTSFSAAGVAPDMRMVARYCCRLIVFGHVSASRFNDPIKPMTLGNMRAFSSTFSGSTFVSSGAYQ
jgi:hypothetical protein